MFDKDKQALFDRFAVAIRKKGAGFDFFKYATLLDKVLDKEGFGMESNRYFGEVWDELDDPKSRWDVDEANLGTFLDALPKDMVKRKLTKNIIHRRIKPADHPKYEKLVANVKEATATFLTENNLLDGTPVTIATVKGGRCSIKVFLGDITDKVSSRSEVMTAILYQQFYDALEQEIGKKRCRQAVADMVPDIYFEIADWPNMATLDDAQYDIVFEFEPDEKLLQDMEEAVALAVGGLFA